MNQRNHDRFGSRNEGRDQDRDDRGQPGRSEAMRSSGYGYGSERAVAEYDMRDYNDGRGRDFGNDDGRWEQRGFATSDFRGSDLRGAGGRDQGESYGGSRHGGDDRWSAPSRMSGRSDGGRGDLRGNDFRSQSWRGEDRGTSHGSYGMRDGMLGHGYDSSYGLGSGGTSSTGGGYGARQKGGRSGYADVSDFGRGGVGYGVGYGGASGIDYGSASNRGNQDFARGRGHDDDRSFGHRVEEWGHRAKEGIQDLFGGPKNYKRSDERIREDVCDRMLQLGRRGHLDPSDIEVAVKDGEVTLTGTVPQREWKHLAEDLSEDVAGVKEVDNRIRVQKQASGLSSSAQASKPSSSSSSSSVAGNGTHTSTATAKS